MKIVLIGFMGSGKTTVAKSLSKLLGISFIEMDDLVYQKTESRNMQEVFAKGGELLLRETEIAIAKECGSKDNLIISTGGGVVLNKIILDYLREKGAIVVFLNAQFDTIAKRLKSDKKRPLFTDLITAKERYDFRLPLYLHYADEIVNTDSLSTEKISMKIQKMIQIKSRADGF